MILTLFGHWLPQLCNSSLFSAPVQSLQATYGWFRPQWHLIRTICLHGGQLPGWQGLGHAWVHPFVGTLVQGLAQTSQLSPA